MRGAMNRTGFLFDKRYLLHETGPYHPEIPERLEAIYKGIEAAGLLPGLTMIPAVPADMRWIETVHDRSYIDRFGDACVAGKRMIRHPGQPDVRPELRNGPAGRGRHPGHRGPAHERRNRQRLLRGPPPGHHAETSEAMGFCYFNNVAIAARYLQQRWGVGRVGIIDFDVHHGNGTQHIFEYDPTVFYYSIHEHPSFAFPGTGREFERGAGPGSGFTQNTPMLPGQGDSEYQQVFEVDLIPDFETFRPEFILVSTGFDAHEDDDMSGISLTTAGFSWIMEAIMGLANRLCGGRMISVLEGGYSLARLPELASNHVRILMNASGGSTAG